MSIKSLQKMKQIASIICLSAAILVMCNSCKKDHGTTPAAPTCLLSEETLFVMNETKPATDWKYEFDANQHLVKANGYSQEGSQTIDVTVSGNIVTINRNGYKQVDTFTGDLWGGTPDSLSTVVTGGANYTMQYKFKYNNRKQIVSVRTNNIFTAKLSYDEKGNLLQFAEYYDAYPGIAYNLSNYSGYDDHLTGYPQLPYWKFMEHNYNILSYGDAYWASTLGGHNPTEVVSIRYDPTSKTFARYTSNYAYIYNETGRLMEYSESHHWNNEDPQDGWQVYFTYPCL